MTMKIRLEIRGLALCFLKPEANAWTVLFPCDQNVHDLWFSHAGMPNPEKLHQPQDTDLRIVFNDVIVEDEPGVDDTDKIFNLNSRYAHAGGLIEKRTKNSVDEIRMLVPYSELDGHDTSFSDYFVQRQDYPGTPVLNVGQVYTMVSLTFRVTDQLVMSVMNGQQLVHEYRIPYADGKSATLSFNNDCASKCRHNDSLDVYELVSDIRNPDLQFASGKISYHDGVTNYRDIDTKSSPYGNCDPAWSNPPPGD